MFDPHTHTGAHTQFDSLCQNLEDYETLPELGRVEAPLPEDDETAVAIHTDTIDAEILAGLVSP
jgi:hypothetical protein